MVAHAGSGAFAYSSSGGTSVAVPYPTGIAAGDKLILVIGQKPSTANGGTVSTPSGWTLVGSSTGKGGYGTTLGADTGNTNIFLFTKIAVGTESGSLSVTVGTNGICWGQMSRATKTASYTWDTDHVAFGERTTAPTSFMQNIMGSTLNITRLSDLFIFGMVIPTDVTTPSQFSDHSIVTTGVTFNTAVEIGEADTQTGNDLGGYRAYTTISDIVGPGDKTLTVSSAVAGTFTNVRGPTWVIQLSEVPPPPGPSFDTLVETFDTKNTSVWLYSGVSDVAGGRLAVMAQEAVQTLISYDLTAAPVYVEMSNTGYGGTAYAYLHSNQGNYTTGYYISIDPSYTVSGGQLTDFGTTTVGTNKYYRFLSGTGTILFQASPDAINWTTIHTLTGVSEEEKTNLWMSLHADTSSSYQDFGGVNVTTSVGPAPTDYWGAAA